MQLFSAIILGFSMLSGVLVQAQTQATPQQQAGPQPVNCADLKTREVVVNGVSYTKYDIVDPRYLKCLPAQPEAPWKVTKTEWSVQDEQNFGTFLKAIGQSKCNTVDNCLSGEANPLRSELDLLATHYSDCADFPYYLRAYFAFKNNLPFFYTTAVEPNELTPEQLTAIDLERQMLALDPEKLAAYEAQLADRRYSRNGNITSRRNTIPTINGAARDFFKVGNIIHDAISSGTLRTFKSPPGKPLPDFYSPQVQLGSIRPGTVLYSVAGHVAIVYDITADGDVLYLDAHPDNSVTRGSFNSKFRVLRSSYGGNFKNFRPFRLENVKYDPREPGRILSAQFRFYADEEIPDYSVEQYEGTSQRQQGTDPVFEYNLKNMNYRFDFYEWVKLRLSNGTYRIRPLNEMNKEMASLCTDVKNRLDAVGKALENNIHLKNHPSRLPRNIFGAEGEWESYSTPGRDLRLKEVILSIASSAKTWISKVKSNYPVMEYSGTNLKADLLRSYHNGVWRCPLTYKNSKGQNINLSLSLVIDRIAQLSYDPYTCVERRWGATSSAELESCTDNQEKAEWHALQQFYRNNIEKDTNGVHGQSLDELRSLNNSGKVNNKDTSNRYNLFELLKGL